MGVRGLHYVARDHDSDKWMAVMDTVLPVIRRTVN